MQRLLSTHLSTRLHIAALAAVLLAGASACGGSPSSPSGSSGSSSGAAGGIVGCEVITGNTTTAFEASGGTASISIRTSASCTWGAVSNASFLTITSGSSGAGEGAITFAVAENTGPVRTATITVTDSNTTVADTVITVTQKAAP